MTAKELYEFIGSITKLPENIICDLHKPCAYPHKHECEEILTHKLINFDDVKTFIQKGRKGPQRSSVDGYTYEKEWYCFVEIKGWKIFLNRNPVANEEEINKQAERYDLEKKYSESRDICLSLSKEKNLFKDKKIAFFLVSDIDDQKGSGLYSLVANLNKLGVRTPTREDYCNQALQNKLDSLPKEVSTFYVECKKFDESIKKLP